MKQFVINERKFSTTNDEVNKLVAGLVKKYPMIIKLLLEHDECQTYNLQAAGGIAGDEYRHLTNQMYLNGLVQPTAKAMSATRRLKKAVDALMMKKKKPDEIDNSAPRSFSDRINLN
jgi:hypothetical protein